VSPVKYELGFYIPEDGILHSHRREKLKSYMSLCVYSLCVVPSTGRKRRTVPRPMRPTGCV
jgi:hypothetical protein